MKHYPEHRILVEYDYDIRTPFEQFMITRDPEVIIVCRDEYILKGFTVTVNFNKRSDIINKFYFSKFKLDEQGKPTDVEINNDELEQILEKKIDEIIERRQDEQRTIFKKS